MSDKNETPKFNLSELPREELDRLAIHLLQADRAREALNVGLIDRLNVANGDAHPIFAEWCAVNKQLSDASNREISLILAGLSRRDNQN